MTAGLSTVGPRDWRGFLRRNAGWLLFVLLPTALVTLYYGLVAADLFASEARFVIRSPSKPQIGGIGSLLQGGPVGVSHDDVYTVHDYLLSRDALRALSEREDLRAVFGRPEADFIARYPNLVYDTSFEDLFLYYGHRVEAVFDSTTGITTLTVKAFRAEDAQRLAKHLLELGEALVNQLNERARASAVRDAEAQVAQAESRVSEVQTQLLSYRTRERLLDPGKSSASVVDSQARTQAELNGTRARLAQIERTAPESPVRRELATRIDILARQVEEQRSRLAGTGDSLAPKISEYNQLVLRQDFAERALTSALASLETARSEARRQQVYLERVVEPNLPDRALFPKRLSSILIVFVSCFILYTIGALLLAGVREHAQT